jgi:hypothetical protein
MHNLIGYAIIAYVLIFGHTYKTLVPKGTLPVGYVIQDGDFTRGFFGSTDKEDLATDPRLVVGHTVIKEIRAGSSIHMSDIQ